MDVGVTLPRRRSIAVDRALAWRLALGALVAASVVARTWTAWLRATPNYFPDEYIYASLSRSIAGGHLPAVRGHVAHFPALLEPILTSPAWWLGVEHGYRAAQAIGALAMSSTAIAVWWTARRLDVSRPLAFAAAALALAVPDAGYGGWLLSEPFAYPLFVAAVGAGAVALARPTPRLQAVFLACALLAAFARIQLAVLVVAYVAAALVLRRLAAQRVVLGGVAIAGVVALAGGLGYYRKAPSAFHLVDPGALGRNAFVLAFAAGWIVVPAAVLGLANAWRSPSEEERAFGVLATLAAAGVLAEATLYGDGGVVHERYAAYAVPLLALGFALYTDRGRQRPRVHAALCAAMFLLAASVPMSGWAAAGGNAHSLVLTALLKVEELLGSPGAGSLAVAAAAGALALVALTRSATVAAILALAFALAASAFATSFDVQNSRNVRAAYLPADARWTPPHATLVAGASNRTNVLEQLFWNPDARLALLPGAAPPDVFDAARTDLRLTGIDGPVVLDEDGVALVPAQPLRMNGSWLSARTPQLRGVLQGRYADGWVVPSGSGRVFGGGRLVFTVTAPEAMTLTIGERVWHLRQGKPQRVSVCGAFSYRFSARGYAGARIVSAKATFPRWSAGC